MYMYIGYRYYLYIDCDIGDLYIVGDTLILDCVYDIGKFIV